MSIYIFLANKNLRIFFHDTHIYDKKIKPGPI